MYAIIIGLYYIHNKGHLEERDKEVNVEVGLVSLPVWKEDCKTICPVSRIRPEIARPAPQ